MATTSELKADLFNIAQELRDHIFDAAIQDTETIYSQNESRTLFLSSALLVSKAFHTSYKNALSRRTNKHATSLHLIIKVQKFGILNKTPITELNDISELLKSLINSVNVKDLLIELEKIERNIVAPFSHSNKLKARDVYHRIIHKLGSLGWTGEHKTNTAVGVVTTQGLHDRTGVFGPGVEDLVNEFHCKKRITQAIDDCPGPSFQTAAYRDITINNVRPTPAPVHNHSAFFDKFDAMN
ncbi:hypothetical protein TI39_contig86g00007 [Zymoseptoria brevis]|uniref:Uncharacterized protein n=1 Tax=Zymoseptoria brevis TaxID=1047168 RepID=A0A0F4H102_9PEZI|nr:hypothetical protein TI39_contig86g00007 [Zymoseptoria brevis]